MKKLFQIFILFLFVLNFFAGRKIFFGKNLSFGFDEDYSYIISFNEKIYKFNDNDFKLKLTNQQKEHHQNLSTLKRLKKLNFSDEEILRYLFPETIEIFEKFSKNFNQDEIFDKVYVKENKCELEFISGKNGKVINREKFFSDCLGEIENNKKSIFLNLEIIDYKTNKNVKELFSEKSCFSTNFNSSSDERKNNIRLALKALDGLVIEEGEIFSFNQITGKRSLDSGYKEAKIISDGTFVSGLGGGVCQVSTTLYNACILSDLEIVEVHNHSLPVSYVEPSFDAMVSFGSADLKVRNNSGGKIIITTSSENDICKIKIFGLKNKYKITRQSEKIKIISAEEEKIITDPQKANEYGILPGEQKRISYAKDGFVSRGYLSFYDEKGNFVKRKQIRENRYNPARGIIIKREN